MQLLYILYEFALKPVVCRYAKYLPNLKAPKGVVIINGLEHKISGKVSVNFHNDIKLVINIYILRIFQVV